MDQYCAYPVEAGAWFEIKWKERHCSLSSKIFQIQGRPSGEEGLMDLGFAVVFDGFCQMNEPVS